MTHPYEGAITKMGRNECTHDKLSFPLTHKLGNSSSSVDFLSCFFAQFSNVCVEIQFVVESRTQYFFVRSYLVYTYR